MIGFELNKEKMGFNKGCWKIKKRRVIKKAFLISEKNRGLQFVEIEDSWNGSIGKESVCAGFGFDKFSNKVTANSISPGLELECSGSVCKERMVSPKDSNTLFIILIKTEEKV